MAGVGHSLTGKSLSQRQILYWPFPFAIETALDQKQNVLDDCAERKVAIYFKYAWHRLVLWRHNVNLGGAAVFCSVLLERLVGLFLQL
jgi:hypothetical protein